MEQNELINRIIEECDNLKEYGINEISPYLQDLINRYQHFAVTSNIVGAVCWGIALILCTICIIHLVIQRVNENDKSFFIDNYGEFNIGGFTVMCICAVFSVIALPLLIYSIYGVIGWINFPEVQLLKEIMQR